MAFDSNIKEIESKIGYKFKDKSLLTQAFTRTSFCNENSVRGGLPYQSNEVLEFFGDSLLSAAIVTLLMRDLSKRYEHGIYTTLGEGDFSNIKSRLSDKKNLSLAMNRLGLQRFLLMGKGDEKDGIENEPSVMEDLFESIIGAIYIDSEQNMSAVISAVSKMLNVDDYIGTKEAPMQSSKNALQEWCADKKHRRDAPVYKTLSESGPDHKKIYERACYIGAKIYGVGQGKNQKLADAAAAEEALKALISEYDATIAKTVTEDTAAAIQRLKDYAAKNKKPSPEFRDLGETEHSTETKREFEIECRFMGQSAKGVGLSKREAKAKAAENIMKLLTKNEQKANKNLQNGKPAKNSANTKKSKNRIPVSQKPKNKPMQNKSAKKRIT